MVFNLYERSEAEQQAYRFGHEDALRFHSGSHLMTQDVFKAETAEYRLSISYDDVTGYWLSVRFKDRGKHVDMECQGYGHAMERAMRFVTEHPAPAARCDVDW